eukprot:TRINITY_DN5441_c0_g1_i3.p1 TRINITY_DN5441_c0_g1~~TRINITY_DN5441_c0_g1_i3.p1  ORF type:complete len:643 (-),score=137.99 TRINITY_DN5441_c0_g1_i3:29-1885(-)
MALQNTFKVSSWNVLAREYSRPLHFPYVNPEILKWTARSAHIAQVYREAGSSIFCLQEVDQFELFHEPTLTSLGYNVVYQKRPGIKLDGLAIAYRTSEFEQESLEPIVVDFDELADSESDVFTRDRFLRSNLGLFVLLRHIASQKLLLVANAHLFWNPMFEDVKLLQCQMLMDRMEAYIANQKLSHVSIVLCGDFNSTPDSEVYNLLANGACNPRVYLRPNSRLLLDVDLGRVARYLRAIGVDAALSPSSSPDDLFEAARQQNRILVTRSKTLVHRKNIPPHLMLRSQDFDDNFTQVVSAFGFKVDAMKVYSRCVECNGTFRKVPVSEYPNLSSVPEKIRNGFGADGNPLEFFACLNCGHVYWWGNQTNRGIEKIISVLAPIMDLSHITHELQQRLGLFASASSPSDSSASSDSSSSSTTSPSDSSSSSASSSNSSSSDSTSSDSTSSDSTSSDSTSSDSVAVVDDVAVVSEALENKLQISAASEESAPVASVLSVNEQGESNEEKEALSQPPLIGDTTDNAVMAGGLWRLPSRCFQHNLRLSSAYSRYRGEEGEPLFTNYTQNFHGTLDYVFYSSATLTLSQLAPLFTVEDAQRNIGFPSSEWPSDHVMLTASLYFS